MYNWELYLGKNGKRPTNIPMTEHVVSSIATPLYGLGHIIYMDNFFSSPALFEKLARNEMGACGTLRVNRTGVPATIKNAKPKAGGPPITDRDNEVLYIAWHDKKPVYMITTVHSSQTFQKQVKSKHHPENQQLVEKPCAIQAYSQHMVGIDRADKAMTYYMVLHRCMKWWKKLFFYLLEVCFCNTLIIWRSIHRKRINAETFRLKIVHGLLQNYRRSNPAVFGQAIRDRPDRLQNVGEHFPCNTKKLPNGKPARLDCAVCSDRSTRRHQTQIMCKKCNEPMCAYPCFERWHKLRDYKVKCTPELQD